MEANIYQIVMLTKNWEKLPMNSKITLHSFITNGQKTSFDSYEMLHTCVKEMYGMSGNKFANLVLILHELCKEAEIGNTSVPISVRYNSHHNSHDMTNLDMSDFSSDID